MNIIEVILTDAFEWVQFKGRTALMRIANCQQTKTINCVSDCVSPSVILLNNHDAQCSIYVRLQTITSVQCLHIVHRIKQAIRIPLHLKYVMATHVHMFYLIY